MRRVLSTLLGVLTALGSTLVMGTIPVAAAGGGGGSYTADYYTDGGRITDEVHPGGGAEVAGPVQELSHRQAPHLR